MPKRTRTSFGHWPVAVLILISFALTPAVGQTPQLAERSFLQKPLPEDAHVRILSWNVRFDSIFPPDGERKDSFRRVVQAVNPDVICLQEIFASDAESRLRQLLGEMIAMGEELTWSVYSANDVVIASRFPFKQCETGKVIRFPLPRRPDFYFGQGMCLIDVPDSVGSSDLYLIGTHLKSRAGPENMKMRQQHADAIISRIRDLKSPGGEIDLPKGTPFVIVGDLNVYRGDPEDAALHLVTLLTGNILDESRFGPDIKPDWDGTDLIEVKPRHNSTGVEFYTWRADDSPFVPGALDRIIYSDSVLKVGHSFVLNSSTMDSSLLKTSGLLATDALFNDEPGFYDHLPVVVDFKMANAVEEPR